MAYFTETYVMHLFPTRIIPHRVLESLINFLVIHWNIASLELKNAQST